MSSAALSGTSVFHRVSFNPALRTTRAFGREHLDRELADPSVFSWIDIEAPNIGELNEVLRRWNIDLVLASHFDAPSRLSRKRLKENFPLGRV